MIQLFERFTDGARKALVLANEEAHRLHSLHIDTGHILVGLIEEGGGIACQILTRLGVDVDELREFWLFNTINNEDDPTREIPYSPRAKKALELALREALQLGHAYIGTEHILLGLLRLGEGAAADVLRQRGVELNEVRNMIFDLMVEHAHRQESASESLTDAINRELKMMGKLLDSLRDNVAKLAKERDE